MKVKLDIPRLPKEVWEELRNRLKRMNSGEKFPDYKTAETVAMTIQQLQKEFAISKEYHIALAPEPGKLWLKPLFNVT